MNCYICDESNGSLVLELDIITTNVIANQRGLLQSLCRVEKRDYEEKSVIRIFYDNDWEESHSGAFNPHFGWQ